jgi:transcriptional regulator with XRE-family HTH domain
VAHRGALNWAIAQEIRERRTALDLTQAQVIAASGIKKATYERLEYGQRTASGEQLSAIGKALGTTGGRLLDAAEARVERGEYPSFGERAAIELDAAIGYRRQR